MIDLFLFLVIVYQGVLIYLQHDKHNQHIESIYNAFHDKVDNLIDRIQAPSFAEYKQAEVKVIKAQKDEPPVERVDLL